MLGLFTARRRSMASFYTGRCNMGKGHSTTELTNIAAPGAATRVGLSKAPNETEQYTVWRAQRNMITCNFVEETGGAANNGNGDDPLAKYLKSVLRANATH
ncbi:hypothetical protein ACA910_010960 [Epithemia clementina (nom. ined.)]